jgi:nucleotide-binding universal stress UspA family protein
MKNILVGVDLQESDQKLLTLAKELAHKFTSRVWIIHVAAPDPDFVGYTVGPQYIRDTRADELRHEHRQLQSYAKTLEQNAISVDALLIQGPTAEMLIAEARKLDIDLLILGSHKHGFLYDLFVGHTAEQVMKDVNIPVLIVPLGR